MSSKNIIMDEQEVNDILHEVLAYAINGLTTSGEHHKQWYLERIILSLGVSLADIREKFADYNPEPGIAP